MNATTTSLNAAPGPVTPQGKAIAARNATTHGLFARDVVLTQLGEDPAAFDALLEQLLTQLPPRHLLERHYLEQIAAASWRLRRLHRWQAQIYEDPNLTEDDRLDKLDKVLRHETALTRQIDRAIRMMNRDLAWLFAGRARDEALYQQNVTDVECRQDENLAIAVQQRVWKQARSASPDADLDYDRLDNTHPKSQESQICENEPPPTSAPSNDENAPPLPLPPGEGWPRHEAGVGSASESPVPSEQVPRSRKITLQDISTPEGYLAYRKREQELYRTCHPDAPEINWDDPEIRQDFGAL